jgi:hypothetical protein
MMGVVVSATRTIAGTDGYCVEPFVRVRHEHGESLFMERLLESKRTNEHVRGVWSPCRQVAYRVTPDR